MNNLEHLEWAKEVPFLAAMPRKNAFLVPDGYFDTMRGQADAGAVITAHAKSFEGGFTVHEGYFAGLTESILMQARLEGVKESTDGFALPEGYFNKLSADILAKTTLAPVKKEARVLRLWASDMMKYASAACVILIAATTLYFNNQHTRVLDTTSTAELYNNEQVLYDIDEDVIVEHVQDALATQTAKTQPTDNAAVEEYLMDNYSANDLAQELK